MFGLMDSLDDEKWEEKEVATKTGTYKEYHILHPHKQIAPTTIGLLIEGDDESAAIPVELLYCKKNKDPLKNVGVSEFKLDADKKIVLGIDLNGDVVEKKS